MVKALDPDASIAAVKPSRCDLCADFHVPGGLGLDFFRVCGVPNRLKVTAHMKGNTLETYYIGAKSGSIQIRVYNKSLEIQSSRKSWFKDVWGEEDPGDVWRVEFQIRRTALRQYHVNSLADLEQKLGGIWENLTSKFYSLRLLDNPNVTRRTVHPWWADVQACSNRFGSVTGITRDLKAANPAALQFYITRAANLLPRFAAIIGVDTLDAAVRDLASAITSHWSERDFAAALAIKRVEEGEAIEATEDSYKEIDEHVCTSETEGHRPPVAVTPAGEPGIGDQRADAVHPHEVACCPTYPDRQVGSVFG